MGDYAPSFGQAQALTYLAGAAIAGGQLAYFTAADTVSPTAGATGALAGVAGHDAAAGASVTVHAGTAVHETASTGGPPPPAPVPTAAGAGGTVLAGTYQVAVSYVNAAGETAASAAGAVITAGTTSTITIPSPPAPPANFAATGWYAYVSQVGALPMTRQQAPGAPTAIGTPLVITAPPANSGLAPQATNTSGIVAGDLVQSAAGGVVTRGAAAGSEIGVAIRTTPVAGGNSRWLARRF